MKMGSKTMGSDGKITLGGKKFKVLDHCGLFDSYWKSGEDE